MALAGLVVAFSTLWTVPVWKIDFFSAAGLPLPFLSLTHAQHEHNLRYPIPSHFPLIIYIFQH